MRFHATNLNSIRQSRSSILNPGFSSPVRWTVFWPDNNCSFLRGWTGWLSRQFNQSSSNQSIIWTVLSSIHLVWVNRFELRRSFCWHRLKKTRFGFENWDESPRGWANDLSSRFLVPFETQQNKKFFKKLTNSRKPT